MTCRWGVLGPGRIASTVSQDLALVDGAERWAVASRDAGRARQFAEEHGFQRSYGSDEDLVRDPDVDVVYVATPHAQHLGAAVLALDAGKPVLVEKPSTTTAAGTARLVDLARHNRLFCMEAMWTRFLPNAVHLTALLRSGVLGQIRAIHADLGMRVPLDPSSRYLDPALGGGALLDVGVYPVSLANQLLGPPTSVQVTGTLGPTGVDLEVALLLGHQDGASALLSASLTSTPARGAWIECTEGWVEVAPSFERMPSVTVHRLGAPPETTDLGRTGDGYAHMLQHVQQCLARGLSESPVMPLQSTAEVMAVMDTALGLLGAQVWRDHAELTELAPGTSA